MSRIIRKEVLIMPIMGIIMMSSPGLSAYAMDITLAWDANTEPDLAGYKLYYGGLSGSYSQSIDVGDVTIFQISALTDKESYYFAATAYDTEGNESGYSNEVSIGGLGDLTYDGPVNIQDIQACVNHILGIQSYGNADVNDSGSVDVVDVQEIVNIILSG